MKKEVFISSITALQKQDELETKNSDLLGQVFPDAESALFVPNLLYSQLILVLQEEMNDTEIAIDGYTWIEYFCMELNFGKNHKPCKVKYKNQTIDLSCPDKLYEFLITLNTKH